LPNIELAVLAPRLDDDKGDADQIEGVLKTQGLGCKHS